MTAEIHEISEAESAGLEEAFLGEIEDDESFALPDTGREGEGNCQRGLSFAYFKGRWRKLVNQHGHHYFSHYGTGKFFRAGSKIYVATA